MVHTFSCTPIHNTKYQSSLIFKGEVAERPNLKIGSNDFAKFRLQHCWLELTNKEIYTLQIQSLVWKF